MNTIYKNAIKTHNQFVSLYHLFDEVMHFNQCGIKDAHLLVERTLARHDSVKIYAWSPQKHNYEGCVFKGWDYHKNCDGTCEDLSCALSSMFIREMDFICDNEQIDVSSHIQGNIHFTQGFDIDCHANRLFFKKSELYEAFTTEGVCFQKRENDYSHIKHFNIWEASLMLNSLEPLIPLVDRETWVTLIIFNDEEPIALKAQELKENLEQLYEIEDKATDTDAIFKTETWQIWCKSNDLEWSLAFTSNLNADNKNARPTPVSDQHMNNVLQCIKREGLNPLALQRGKGGKAGDKARIKKLLTKDNSSMTKSVFDRTWQTAREEGKIKDSD